MRSPEPVIYLVDDDDAVRHALSLLLQAEGYTVRAYAGGRAFLEACGPAPQGCAIVDLRMPGMDGIALQAEMARRGLALPVIFLTAHGDIPSTVKAIKAGAADFLIKPVTGTSLVRSVAAALDGARALDAPAAQDPDAAARIDSLTARESEVMRLVVQGRSNKEIGKALGISHRTVEIHKAHVMDKAGADNAMDLARLARRAGIDE